MSSAHLTSLEELGHLGDQILSAGAPHGLASDDDDVVSLDPSRRDRVERRSQDPPGSVPLHSPADLLAGNEREFARAWRDEHDHPFPVNGLTVTEDPLDPPGAHRLAQPETLRRLRLFRRRAARIARPARVRIRRRKPWVFARRRVFG
jgi:hypothetical protein